MMERLEFWILAQDSRLYVVCLNGHGRTGEANIGDEGWAIVPAWDGRSLSSVESLSDFRKGGAGLGPCDVQARLADKIHKDDPKNHRTRQ